MLPDGDAKAASVTTCGEAAGPEDGKAGAEDVGAEEGGAEEGGAEDVGALPSPAFAAAVGAVVGGPVRVPEGVEQAARVSTTARRTVARRDVRGTNPRRGRAPGRQAETRAGQDEAGRDGPAATRRMRPPHSAAGTPPPNTE
ncbi:hypothetical protein Asp14428_61990 [Actinoplanes sp. NBRC 14428]|nr:hypothetical protein Asp14428_61990 [Actinoplanes sp. NBRC 14428]